ncbi:hypothetical protein [Aquabacterium humicola]|nr:hypothetical protein [Rubrivivax pictus]
MLPASLSRGIAGFKAALAAAAQTERRSVVSMLEVMVPSYCGA